MVSNGVVLDRKVALDPDTIPPSTNPSVFFRLDAWSQRVIRAYLIGLVSARLGDATSAERALQPEAQAVGAV